MQRTLLLGGLALMGLSAGAALGRAEVKVIVLHGGKGGLGVVDGAPCRVVGARSGDWELTLSDKTTIRVEAPERYAGLYLAYDPTGKKDGVFLVNKRGKGTGWAVERAKGRRPGVYTIRAAEGASKGWYLDAGGKAERHKSAKGKTFDARPLRLTKEPGVSHFEITPIAP